ncbi:MAG: RES family NAD+ phosphorylase [Bacteroidota bacterium]
MIVYRLAKLEYANSLQSSGSPNRWNRAQQFVIYTSGTMSLCALELLAHSSGLKPAGTYRMMKIEMDEPISQTDFKENDLPENWSSLSAYELTQTLGSNWYASKKSLVLRVPSAIITSENNYVINTMHPDYPNKVRLVGADIFFWDKRFPPY